MSKDIIVIGGGIIGLCCAYFLRKEGHRVSILEQSMHDHGASFVNAGYLCPSHVIPLQAPGMIRKGISMLLDSRSPLYVKPRMDMELLKWGKAFASSCTAKNVDKVIPVIKELSLMSQKLFEQIMTEEKLDAHFDKRGLLMLCKDEKTLSEEIEAAELAGRNGIVSKYLMRSELKKAEPNIHEDVLGAIHFTGDWHSTPSEFMQQLRQKLLDSGVYITRGCRVEKLLTRDDKIKALITDKGRYEAEEIVLAAGAWSSELAKSIGLSLLMQAGKGYRLDVHRSTGIKVPAILCEKKVAITPMRGFTRIAGTMEIAGVNHQIDRGRINTLSNAAEEYYTDLQISETERSQADCGLRPVSPDGLPYIGKTKKYRNLTIASGHSMLGWSMATATGLIVSELISDKGDTIADQYLLSPERSM